MEDGELLPGVEMMLKIESRRGLEFAHRYRGTKGRLMAARGDLYVEVLRPHTIIGALRDIVAADQSAVAGSRLFESLVQHPVPESADIGDAAFLLAIGYRTFLLGDAVCVQRDTTLEALNVLEAVAREFP